MSDKEPTQNVETQSDSISMQEQMQSMMQLMQQQMELQQQQFDALRQQMELQQQQFDVFCQELKEVKAEIKEVKEGQSLLRTVVDNFKREFNRFREFTENGINSLNDRVKNIETGINKGFTDLTNNTKELGAQLYGKINDYTLSIGEGLVSIKKEVMKPIEITQTVMKEMKEKRVEEEKDKLVKETIKILRSAPKNTSWEGTIGDYTVEKEPAYVFMKNNKTTKSLLLTSTSNGYTEKNMTVSDLKEAKEIVQKLVKGLEKEAKQKTNEKKEIEMDF